MWDHQNELNDPPPSWLMAYFDGELCEQARQQVEAWLARNPEALRFLEEEDRLSQMMQQTTAPEPESEKWARVLGGVVGSVSAVSAGSPKWRRWAGVAGAAAVLLVGLATIWWSQRPVPITPSEPVVGRVPSPDEDLTPFPVAELHRTSIESMDVDDVGALVVGRPPVEGELTLASAGDIQIDRLEPHADGALPDFHQPANGTPMVVGPLVPVWGGD